MICCKLMEVLWLKMGVKRWGGNESSVHRVMVNGQLGVLFDTEVPSPQFHYQSNTVSPCAPVAKHWGSLSLGLFGKSSQRWSDGRSTPCWHWPGGEAAKVGAFEWAKGPRFAHGFHAQAIPSESFCTVWSFMPTYAHLTTLHIVDIIVVCDRMPFTCET